MFAATFEIRAMGKIDRHDDFDGAAHWARNFSMRNRFRDRMTEWLTSYRADRSLRTALFQIGQGFRAPYFLNRTR